MNFMVLHQSFDYERLPVVFGTSNASVLFIINAAAVEVISKVELLNLSLSSFCEYNGMAHSSRTGKLYVGTFKGEVDVYNVEEK